MFLFSASVAQWIEQSRPKGKIQVRFLLEAQKKRRFFCASKRAIARVQESNDGGSEDSVESEAESVPRPN